MIVFLSSSIVTLATRHHQRKDIDVDLQMCLKLMKMYYCTGHASWVKEFREANHLSRNFLMKKMIIFARSFICDNVIVIKDHEEYSTKMHEIDKWFNNVTEKGKSLEMSHCVERELIKLAKNVFCCTHHQNDVSYFYAATVHSILSNDCVEKPSAFCRILMTLFERNMFKEVAELLKKIGICKADSCTIDAKGRIQRSPTSLNLTRKKRQFDMEQTMSAVEAMFCSQLIHTSALAGAGASEEDVLVIGILAIVMGPTCCVI